jgi:hypothetical protein
MRIRTAFSICVIYAAVLGAAAKGAGLPKTAELIGADTVLLVDIGDFNQLKTKFEKTSFGKLYNDPAMSAFVKNITAKVREKINEENDSFVKGVLDANIMPEGRLAFVMSAGQQEMSMALVSQWGRNVGRVKDTLDKMVLKSIEKGAHRGIESYRDVNIVTPDNGKRRGFGEIDCFAGQGRRCLFTGRRYGLYSRYGSGRALS